VTGAGLQDYASLALGDALGSNIFNGLWIVPVAAVIYPIGFDLREVAVALGSGVLAMLALFPPAHGLIGRGRGVMLMAVYAGYVGAILVW